MPASFRLNQACWCSRAPSGLTLVSLKTKSFTTWEGAASMVEGTTPVCTMSSQPPKKAQMLSTGRILR